MKKVIVYVIPIILWMWLIFFVSSQSHAPSGYVHVSHVVTVDYVAGAYHLFMYAMLAFLLRRALLAYDIKHAVWIALFIAVLYGASDEIHQLFVPFRDASVKDVMIDASGAVIASWKKVVQIPRILRARRRKF